MSEATTELATGPACLAEKTCPQVPVGETQSSTLGKCGPAAGWLRSWPIWNCVWLVFSLLLFGYLSVRSGKDNNYDLRNYHYYQAHALFHDRFEYDYGAAQLGTFLNPVLDIPFYCFVAWFRAWKVGFLMGALHGINFWLLLNLARLVLRGEGGWGRSPTFLAALACAAVGMYSPIGVSELGTAFNDLLCSLFVLGALYLLLWRYQEGRGSTWAVVAGCLFGVGLGGKLTLTIFLPALVLGAALAAPTWWGRVKGAAAFLLAAGASAVLCAGYWMSVVYHHFLSPIYPFYNAYFRSPYYALQNDHDGRFGPKGLRQLFTFPYLTWKDYKLTAELPYQDCRFLIAFGLLAVFLTRLCVLRRHFVTQPGEGQSRRHSLLVPMLLFFFLSYGVWEKQFAIERYAAALEMLAPLVILLLCLWIIPRRVPALVAALACLVVVAVTMKPPDWGRLPWSRKYFEVQVPPLAEDDHSLVLLAGTDPLSYVIPSFPEHTRFIRVLHHSALTDQEVKQIVDEHHGDIYLLSDCLMSEESIVDYSQLGLTPDLSTFQPLSVGFRSYAWCKATRVTQPSGPAQGLK